ncbi:hypothetical protein GE09DRAFT_315500 [Coniochaeta sp. 2T2.1]|nr:hypothetical protein GE09DRAFT_315500 [Coniochaeta sp. 2T2.1]
MQQNMAAHISSPTSQMASQHVFNRLIPSHAVGGSLVYFEAVVKREYYKRLPHKTTTRDYHTRLPRKTSTEYCHTRLPHKTTTQDYTPYFCYFHTPLSLTHSTSHYCHTRHYFFKTVTHPTRYAPHGPTRQIHLPITADILSSQMGRLAFL